MTENSKSETLPSQPRKLESVERWDREHDVVVVGLGAAGGAAAIEAARAGADTLVLERATRGGGATALAEGTIYFGGGTRVQKTAGFEDSLDNMPESLQYAPTGELLQERIDACDNAMNEVDSACQEPDQ